MGKKIVITATFREFNGNTNDKIQRLFLESVKNQTYQDYLLAVTLFKEKNVTTVLVKEEIPHVVFQGDAKEHRYSLTQVLLNGIKVAKENKDSILLWTTCDVIFGPDFFEKIVAKIKSQTCGTSYPHLIYNSLNDYKDNKNGHLLWGGIDTIFFSSDTFTEPRVGETIKKYPNEGWGHGDYFLVALGRAFYKNMINIRAYSKIKKVSNDRKISEETTLYLYGSDKINSIIFRQFLRDFHINDKKSIKSLNSTIFFLSYKFDSIKDIWINISVYVITLVVYPIKRTIYKIKVALKILLKL